MKVLHLTIKKKYFDMIDCEEKPEEYREINDFWIKRLCDTSDPLPKGTPLIEQAMHYPFIEWDAVLFANGGHFGNVPKQTRQWKGMEINEGLEKWGAEPGKKYFVIKLGDKI